MEKLDMFIRYMNIMGRSKNTIKQFPRYIEEFSDVTKATTVEDYKVLKLSDFESYLEALQEKGNSDATRNTKLSAVKSFFKYLSDNDLIDKNIADRVNHSKTQKKLSVQPTREEAKKILDSVKRKPKLHTLYTLLMNSGLRIEEALSLRIQDFRDGCIFVINGKGGKDRVVPINSKAQERLQKYIATERKVWSRESLVERHNGDKKLVQKAWEDKDLIFLGKNGLRMFNSNVNASMDYTAERCNISKDKVHPHAFRHYFANEFVKQGGRVQDLQSQLGHASLKTTQIYFDNDTTQVQKAMNGMTF